jgi:hypothetical protein
LWHEVESVFPREGFEALGITYPSQNIEPQHPPHKKQGDDPECNVGYPLAAGFWFSKVEHSANRNISLSRRSLHIPCLISAANLTSSARIG